jgi:O-antigen/teichoic acid export membrane protein
MKIFDSFVVQVLRLIAPFNRGHAKFIGTSAVTQLLPLISLPVLTRLYTPEDFGVYAVFNALVSVLGGIAPLSLNHACTLEDDSTDRLKATIVGSLVAVIFSGVVLVVIIVIPTDTLEIAVGKDASRILIWLPISISLAGIYACLYSLAVKEDLFRLLARNKLLLGLATVVSQVLISLVHAGPKGLVISNLLGYCLAILLLGKHMLNDKQNRKLAITTNQALAVVKRHSKLIVWTTPAAVVNYISNYLPALLLNRHFDTATIGHFSLANRLVTYPLVFVSSSIQDIFRQQATDEMSKYGDCSRSFQRFLRILGIVGLVLVIPLVLIIPFLLPFALGSQWKRTGEMIPSISLLVLTRFISAPLSYVWLIRGRQKLDLLWQFGLAALVASTLVLAPTLPQSTPSISTVLWAYSVGVALWYVLSLVISARLSRS